MTRVSHDGGGRLWDAVQDLYNAISAAYWWLSKKMFDELEGATEFGGDNFFRFYEVYQVLIEYDDVLPDDVKAATDELLAQVETDANAFLDVLRNVISYDIGNLTQAQNDELTALVNDSFFSMRDHARQHYKGITARLNELAPLQAIAGLPSFPSLEQVGGGIFIDSPVDRSTTVGNVTNSSGVSIGTGASSEVNKNERRARRWPFKRRRPEG